VFAVFSFAQVVMSDGATFRIPSATRLVGNTLPLERDSANHPVYLGKNDATGLMSRREEARLQRIQRKGKLDLFDD